ncbi:hypothetical protein [Psychromonas sp. MB-3u-54]|uniref:hypothetical protein n=1 Tax=Psychromonas sp. MB-3u-54 TaxID=2058319 RepID=UPI0012FEF9FA|nr:hypothetical protein [Psychromonas sp. MB-3u-54]
MHPTNNVTRRVRFAHRSTLTVRGAILMVHKYTVPMVSAVVINDAWNASYK